MSGRLILKRKGFFGRGLWWGVEYSMVLHDEVPYLERWIAYIGSFTLRLHKFHNGDDDRAPHDHPWWFITFPFRSYIEAVPDNFKGGLFYREVKAFRFHYRPATYQHIVKMTPFDKPFYTFVISGQRSRGWGFWPSPTKFVGYKDWT